MFVINHDHVADRQMALRAAFWMAKRRARAGGSIVAVLLGLVIACGLVYGYLVYSGKSVVLGEYAQAAGDVLDGGTSAYDAEEAKYWKVGQKVDSFILTTGKVLKDCTIVAIDPVGVTLQNPAGTRKIMYSMIAPELRKNFRQ